MAGAAIEEAATLSRFESGAVAKSETSPLINNNTSFLDPPAPIQTAIDDTSVYSGIVQTLLPFNPVVWVLLVVLILLPISALMYYFVVPHVIDNKETETYKIGMAILFALPFYMYPAYLINRRITQVGLNIAWDAALLV